MDDAFFLLLEDFFLGRFRRSFGHKLCFPRGLLLVGNGSAARAFARARVGVGPLAAYRQAAAMPHAAVGAHLDVALDIHRDLLAQITFHRAFLFEDGAHLVDFFLGQVADLLVEFDPRAMEQGTRTAAADAVNVSQTDFRSLLWRQIYACKTCHNSPIPDAAYVLDSGR